jgi:hypothetical protein
MWWFNRQRNGYRMACKPPEYREHAPPRWFQGLARIPPCLGGLERTQARALAAPGGSRPAGALLSDRPASAGHCRRNAVGRVGVKLGAAPDAPHWGEVLVRTPSDRFSGARMRAASNFTCLSREHPACPADTTSVGGDVHGSGPEPRLRWPASSGGGRRGRKTRWPSAGLRIADNPAWASARPIGRQLPPVQRDSGQYTTVPAAVARTPGRTPSERNDGLVLG